MTEKLINCPRCNSNACSEMANEQITIWQCMGCGFTSNTYLTEDYANKYKELLPELYKALEYIDNKGLRWYPTAVTMEDKSMIFAEGTSIEDWKWTAVKSKEVPETNREKFKGDTHTADYSTKQEYPEREFMDALEYVGYFNLKQ
jgi:hypothetical protein